MHLFPRSFWKRTQMSVWMYSTRCPRWIWPLAYGRAAVTRIFRSDIRILRLPFPDWTSLEPPQDIRITVKPECRKSYQAAAGCIEPDFTVESISNSDADNRD